MIELSFNSKQILLFNFIFSKQFFRYAIGKAERPILKSKIGWLDILANDTHEYYYPNNTGGPSIKVSLKFGRMQNRTNAKHTNPTEKKTTKKI